MKIAVFGGSFNPLHKGHAVMAETVLEELAYDRIIFIPTATAPHKTTSAEGCRLPTAEQRFSMVEAFCKSRKDGRFVAEDCEIKRGGISYTIDTIRWIYENYRFDGKPGLIMGEEIAAEFNKWKCPEKIAELCDLIIVRRELSCGKERGTSAVSENVPTGDYVGDAKAVFQESHFSYPHVTCSNNLVNVSSTEIREKIASGKSFSYLLPESVAKYIEGENLYGRTDQ